MCYVFGKTRACQTLVFEANVFSSGLGQWSSKGTLLNGFHTFPEQEGASGRFPQTQLAEVACAHLY